MTRYIHFIEVSGRIWRVNAHEIAYNRAVYYANVDEDTTYEEEYNFTLNNEYELTDWYWSNMDPEDLQNVELIKDITFPEGPDWGNIKDYKVIDSDD